jgi:hypothetical protein
MKHVSVTREKEVKMRAVEEEVHALHDGAGDELPELDAVDPHPLPAEIIDLEHVIPE